MLNPFYFIDGNSKVGFKMLLDSHHIIHANSKMTVTPNYHYFGIEVRYISKIMKKLSVIYARLLNQCKFKYQTVFSAKFDKQNEDNQVMDETELFNNLNINHNLTQTDIDKIDVKSPLEQQIQQQEMKDSGWRFDQINSMTVFFYKTGEFNGSNYVKTPLISNPISNTENKDKYCFIWSILASIHPFNNNHPNRVSNYKHYIDELNINVFDFTKGIKCSDVHRFNEINNLLIYIFEKTLYQDQNKWRHKLIPIEIIKNKLDRILDLAIYKNHFALIKKLNAFLGDHRKTFICRRCLSSYTSEHILKLQKPKCENNDKTTIRFSNESHLHWKNHFHKNPLFFRIYADFEADNEKDNSNIGNKTTNMYISKTRYLMAIT